jgi:hypothetical protein
VDPSVFDRVSSPDYLAGLDGWPMAELRARRSECQTLEDQVSYARRMVQGRLDVVRGELDRRRTGAAPSALSDLVDQLPGSLADSPSTSSGRVVSVADVGALFPIAHGALDASGIEQLPELSDADVAELADRLGRVEAEMSSTRRAVFDRLDALSDELTRRYRSGEAVVDDLLK